MNRAPATTLQVTYCLWGGSFIAVPAVGAFERRSDDLFLIGLAHDVAVPELEQDREVPGVPELWVTETLVTLKSCSRAETLTWPNRPTCLAKPTAMPRT